MRRPVPIVLSAILLVFFAGCSFFVYDNQIEPRLSASAHTEEMCAALQRFRAIRQEIYDTGDVSRLPEIFVSSWVGEETKWVRYNATQDKLFRGITQIVSCRATYYMPAKAEIEATDRNWERIYDRHTGQLVVPMDPSLLNQARESRFRMVFVKEQSVWKYSEDEGYDWHFVNVEPPSP